MCIRKIVDTTCGCLLLDTLLGGQVGSQANPVKNVALHDLTVAHADVTYLLPYETPSGGGYSVHRGGAIHIEGAENPSVTEVSHCRLNLRLLQCSAVVI